MYQHQTFIPPSVVWKTGFFLKYPKEFNLKPWDEYFHSPNQNWEWEYFQSTFNLCDPLFLFLLVLTTYWFPISYSFQ